MFDDNDNSLPNKEGIKSLSKSNDLLKASKDFLIFSQSLLYSKGKNITIFSENFDICL